MSPPPRGVTLIELLVALAVVAILVAIAWPGYAATLRRAHRVDARLALLRVQQLQEIHYATHLRYASRLGASRDEETLTAPDRSADGLYEVSLRDAAHGQGYLATASAVPHGSQMSDRDCRQLTVDQVGRRRSADAGGTWTDADPHRCWG